MASEVGQLLQQWLEDARALAAQHARLAREELRAWHRRVGPQAGVALTLLPGIVVGLLLVCVGAALALARYLPLPLAFVATGLLVSGPGIWALVVLIRSVRRAAPILGTSRAEVEGTIAALHPAGERA